MHQAAHPGRQRRFGDVTYAVDVDPPDGPVRVAGDRDPGGQMEDEFRSGKGVLQYRRVENVAFGEVDIEPLKCCTPADVNRPYGLSSGDESPYDVHSQVP